MTQQEYEQKREQEWREYLFGRHNLTSDAEGEELLTCEKYKVEEALNYCDELDSISGSHNMLNWGKQIIAYLFGSKCLLDAHEDKFTSIEPKPAEPKFNLGDKAILKGYVCTITSIVYEQGKFVGYKIESPLLHGIATVPESDLEPYTAAEQSMTDSETEHTKDEFVARMRGKLTEQDLTEAKQMTENCVTSLSQFELPKQIEAQINKVMESIKAESRKQFGDFGAANADIEIPMYRQMMRLGALLALSAGDLESEQTDSDRGDYISMTKPTDPNKCTLFGREEADSK